jgi:hypothetical protein
MPNARQEHNREFPHVVFLVRMLPIDEEDRQLPFVPDFNSFASAESLTVQSGFPGDAKTSDRGRSRRGTALSDKS